MKRDDIPPAGQTALTLEEFNSMSVFHQGYAHYYQSAWNSKIPEVCPYKFGTPEQEQFYAGEKKAMFECIDMEE